MSTSAVEIQARTLAGYADASRLRQVHDRDWVLDQAPDSPQVLLDLGCGIGQLLRAALERHPTLRQVVGLDGSEHRLAEAAGLLQPYGDRVALHRADLTEPAPLPYRPDLVTMTSVLHWLYPRERQVFAWVRDQLAPGGSFLLTTYHPEPDSSGLGGEDEIVRDALTALGVERESVPGLFAGAGVVPIGTRTRPVGELAELLGEFLAVQEQLERPAEVTVDSAAQYQHFHAATFGDYYSRLVGPEQRGAFFRAVGEAAWRRQVEHGWVSRMPVRLWRLAALG